ncbi:MAG: citrate/2-methylcitrate synthase [Butyricicoccus sp.]|nr:citrate/2-methylcitrate synthase [Butyricicoccus sp.]
MVYNEKVIDQEIINELCEKVQPLNNIGGDVFMRYGVKRGLRNADGTGVLAGITRLGNVHGYLLDEGERMPIEGRLTYRGINIYDLINSYDAENRFGFEEVCYLLLSGSLPNREQLDRFSAAMADARDLPMNFTEDMIMRAPSRDIMNKLASATLALYSYDKNPDDISPENVMRQGISLISRLPVIISHAYQAKRRYFDNKSMYLHEPDCCMSTAENILRLIRPDKTFTDAEAKLLDRCLILHAEHGAGNNSTFVCRVATSSGTDTYSAVAAAISSLKGPRHGGANLKVCQMFDDIKENVRDLNDRDEVYSYLGKILDKQAGDSSGLIYGMGHAIYTLSDPRAVALKACARPLAREKGYEAEFNLIETVEQLTPQLFADRYGDYAKVMCANVDMYSGLVYTMLGIPQELFTPLFATARIAGYVAHRIEEIAFGGKIVRPAYKTMVKGVPFIPLDERV